MAPRVADLTYTLGDYEREVVAELGPEVCAPFKEAFAPVAETFEVCP